MLVNAAPSAIVSSRCRRRSVCRTAKSSVGGTRNPSAAGEPGRARIAANPIGARQRSQRNVNRSAAASFLTETPRPQQVWIHDATPSRANCDASAERVDGPVGEPRTGNVRDREHRGRPDTVPRRSGQHEQVLLAVLVAHAGDERAAHQAEEHRERHVLRRQEEQRDDLHRCGRQRATGPDLELDRAREDERGDAGGERCRVDGAGRDHEPSGHDEQQRGSQEERRSPVQVLGAAQSPARGVDEGRARRDRSRVEVHGRGCGSRVSTRRVDEASHVSPLPPGRSDEASAPWR